MVKLYTIEPKRYRRKNLPFEINDYMKLKFQNDDGSCLSESGSPKVNLTVANLPIDTNEYAKLKNQKDGCQH